MILWHIAVKNFKTISKNYLLLTLLILMPLMQIAMINIISDNTEAQALTEINGQYVELIILPSTNGVDMVQAFSTGTLVQFLLLTSMIAGATIVGEREDKTMIRLYAAPISKLKILTGILLGHSVTILMVSAVIMIVSHWIFHVHWGASLISLAVVTLSAVYVAAAISFTIVGIFRSAKIAGGVMSIVVIAMTFMGGGLIPAENLGKIPNFTINKWINEAYLKLAQGGSLEDIGENLIVMVVMGTLLMLVASLLCRGESAYE